MSYPRDRIVELAREIDRFAEGADAPDAMLGQVKIGGTPPIEPKTWYTIAPTTISGPEAEGGSAGFAASGGDRFLAYNLGTSVPENGTYVVCHCFDGRWVFRHD